MIEKENRPVKILTVPGLNILAPLFCKGCSHLTERRMCSIWAFPETKWQTEKECPDYSPERRIH